MEYPSPLADASRMEPGRSHPSAVLTCLIADDNRPIRAALQEVLRAAGMEVVGVACSGADAIRLLKRHKPGAMILDLRLGECDGLQLARRTADISPDTAVILYTSYASPQLISEALGTGVKAVVLKEASASKLLEVLLGIAAG